jgi:hypothetical protein
LRDHNKELGVTNAEDFKNEWQEKAKERARFFSGDASFGRRERIEALKQAFEKHRRT